MGQLNYTWVFLSQRLCLQPFHVEELSAAAVCAMEVEAVLALEDVQLKLGADLVLEEAVSVPGAEEVSVAAARV